MILAVDVGGTYIKYGLISNGKIENKDKLKTPDGKEIIHTIKGIYKDFSKDYGIEGVAISSAGQVDVQEGKITYASDNIPNYTGQEIKKELQKDLKVKVCIENDVTSCLYNYSLNDLLYISIGTGVGGAYKSKEILRGHNFSEMEVGYLNITDEFNFEQLCSADALLKFYTKTTGENITGEKFNQLYLQKDKVALDLLDIYFDNFSKAIINLIYILDPEYIILGGGITEAEFFDIEILKDKINFKSNILEKRNIKLEKSKLGNDAALLGVYKKLILEENNG